MRIGGAALTPDAAEDELAALSCFTENVVRWLEYLSGVLAGTSARL